MLAWRCARGKRRKYSSKKRIVCQEEKRLFVKKEKKELVCQMEKSLYMKRNYEESVCQEEKIFFSGRRIGQFAYLSGREELVMQRRIRNRFIC